MKLGKDYTFTIHRTFNANFPVRLEVNGQTVAALTLKELNDLSLFFDDCMLDVDNKIAWEEAGISTDKD